jgi:hypothetical protein
MGTRSLTYVFDHHNNDVLTCIYRQYDGYIAGHGLEIASYLSKFTIVNGLGARDEEIKIANGMGCLSAQLIGHLKAGEAGNIYIYPPLLNQDCGQEYEYHVYQDKIEAYSLYSSYGKAKTKLFSGSWVEFFEYCKATKKQEEKEVA